MLLAVRPTIGWLGYFMIGKSVPRFAIVLLVLAATSVFLIRRSKESLTLQFITPALGKASIVILPPPKQTTFSSFDACAVESAINPALSGLTPNGEKKEARRPVILYLWSSNIAPDDTWIKLLSKIGSVKIYYLNFVKTLRSSPIEGLFNYGGWGGRPGWAVWLASGISLLWRFGGILVPTGVVMTKPLMTEPFGNNSGVIVLKNKKVKPIAFGSPPHHSVLERILDDVENFDHSLYDSYVYKTEAGTPLESFLTNSISKECDLSDLKNSFCKNFQVLNADLLYDLDLNNPSTLNEDSALFLRFTGDSEKLKYDLGQSKKFFRKHGLVRYCPKVYHYLENLSKYHL